MKTLVLLRHAKSDRDDPSLDDKDRPLASRGRRAAPRIGAWLAQQNVPLDRILVSSALRTRQTWALVEPHLKAPFEVSVRDDLYHATAKHLTEVFNSLEDTVSGTLVVAHNPGLEDLATLLTGHGDKAIRSAMAAKFPSGACAILTFDRDSWKNLKPKSGRLTAFTVPRALDHDD